MTRNISILEFIWTLVSGIGLVFLTWLFIISVEDYEFVLSAKLDKFRKFSARTSVLLYLGGMVTQSTYTTVGIIAMTQPSAPRHHTAMGYAIASIFIFSSAVSSLLAATIFIRRRKLVKMIEEHMEVEGHIHPFRSKHE